MSKEAVMYVVTSAAPYSGPEDYQFVRAFYTKQAAQDFVSRQQTPMANFEYPVRRNSNARTPGAQGATRWFIGAVPVESVRDESYDVIKFKTLLGVLKPNELESLAVALDHALETVRPTG